MIGLEHAHSDVSGKAYHFSTVCSSQDWGTNEGSKGAKLWVLDNVFCMKKNETCTYFSCVIPNQSLSSA